MKFLACRIGIMTLLGTLFCLGCGGDAAPEKKLAGDQAPVNFLEKLNKGRRKSEPASKGTGGSARRTTPAQ
ncbi:MAG: hypothetical protein NVSMB9_12670 [Isosphaeraceae bacterium]